MTEPEPEIRRMIAGGYLVYHPDDLGKPEGERRLLKTEKGERQHAQIEARLAQRGKADQS